VPVFGCSDYCPLGVLILNRLGLSMILLFWLKSKIFLRQHRAAFFSFSPTERELLRRVLHVFRSPYSCDAGPGFLCLLVLRKTCSSPFCMDFFGHCKSHILVCKLKRRWFHSETSCSCGNWCLSCVCECECSVERLETPVQGPCAVGHDAEASADLSVLTEDCTSAWSCRSSPFSCIALSFASHRYTPLYVLNRNDTNWSFNLYFHKM